MSQSVMFFGVDLSLLAYLNRCGIHFYAAVPISISPGRSKNDDNTTAAAAVRRRPPMFTFGSLGVRSPLIHGCS